MAHPNAKLTPAGRLILVMRILEEGWPVAQAACAMGVSRQTAHRWVRRFRQEGPEGLSDRPSRPHRRPHALPREQVERVLRCRRRCGAGPHRISEHTGLARSTCYGILRRHGLSRLSDADRVSRVPIRYERSRPGELLHLDVKKLARVPPGGGWRVLGRQRRLHRLKGRVGYDYVHVAVDDRSRVAYCEVHPDERGETCARFLLAACAFFAERGVRVEQVMTDQAKGYCASRAFQEALAQVGARHVRTRSYRPQTNGKAERFIRTLLTEWAYARPHRSNGERRSALASWLHHYNHHRPHTALGGQTPMRVLVNNVGGNDT